MVKNRHHKTEVMGILNLTPDSFSDGGQFDTWEKALSRVGEMIDNRADIIDIGGESTRPGTDFIDEQTELSRVLPVIQAIRNEFHDIPLSIDTYKAVVAEKALAAGVNMVNSLGGFRFDQNLAHIVAKHACPIIVYHIKGEPKTMQQGEIRYADVIGEIAAFFEEQIAIGEKHGIKREQFFLDPGIGFGKTTEQNLEIIRRLNELKTFGLPIVIGVSRKSHLGALLREKLDLSEIPSPRERLEASLAETAIAVRNGAHIVRTHDVFETKRFLAVLDELMPS
jgi:dihydropteroate synthase